MTTPKLVLIAIDAADARLVRKWAKEGHLPTFASLLGSGLVAPIATPPAVLEGGIWPTLLTSSLPATHGMISYQELKHGSYDIANGMYAEVDRGYERIDERLRSLGARITREPGA